MVKQIDEYRPYALGYALGCLEHNPTEFPEQLWWNLWGMMADRDTQAGKWFRGVTDARQLTLCKQAIKESGE